LFRNEILLANKSTPDEGLTFLDEETLKKVFDRMPSLMDQYRIKSPEELLNHFHAQRFHIASIKQRIWNLMIDEEAKENRISSWAESFHKAYYLDTPEEERAALISQKDLLTKIAVIWGASKSGQINLLNKICEREKKSDSWEVQASLTTSPSCPPDYLHHIATSIGKDKGYGYILRIISRNPNVQEDTLKSIANDPAIEPRYAQCAVAALEGGGSAANHQI
jgi:hypothetical protein